MNKVDGDLHPDHFQQVYNSGKAEGDPRASTFQRTF